MRSCGAAFLLFLSLYILCVCAYYSCWFGFSVVLMSLLLLVFSTLHVYSRLCTIVTYPQGCHVIHTFLNASNKQATSKKRYENNKQQKAQQKKKLWTFPLHFNKRSDCKTIDSMNRTVTVFVLHLSTNRMHFDWLNKGSSFGANKNDSNVHLNEPHCYMRNLLAKNVDNAVFITHLKLAIHNWMRGQRISSYTILTLVSWDSSLCYECVFFLFLSSNRLAFTVEKPSIGWCESSETFQAQCTHLKCTRHKISRHRMLVFKDVATSMVICCAIDDDA